MPPVPPTPLPSTGRSRAAERDRLHRLGHPPLPVPPTVSRQMARHLLRIEARRAAEQAGQRRGAWRDFLPRSAPDAN